jgi:hypothetical protein
VALAHNLLFGTVAKLVKPVHQAVADLEIDSLGLPVGQAQLDKETRADLALSLILVTEHIKEAEAVVPMLLVEMLQQVLREMVVLENIILYLDQMLHMLAVAVAEQFKNLAQLVVD